MRNISIKSGKKTAPARSGGARRTRKPAGSVLVEGVVGTCLFIAIAVPTILLLANVGLLFLYQDKINRVAQEAAEQLDAGTYYIGSKRQSAIDHPEVIVKRSQKIADKMASLLGFGTIAWDTPEFVSEQIGGRTITLVKTHCTVKNLKFLGGFQLPITGVSGTGVACDNAWPPEATCLLAIEDKDHPELGKAVEFPIYGCLKHDAGGFRPNGTPYANYSGWTGDTTRAYATAFGLANGKITRIHDGRTIAEYNW